MKLYVICGHGAGDPGACRNDYTEANLVRLLGRKIKQLGGDSVVLLDTTRNWYADAGINSLTIPSDACLVELHMDAGSTTARGGHVIIKAGIGGPDVYDKALASGISRFFPGRAQTIVERSDLANPNRAYLRGINYRLVENGFITNTYDVVIFLKSLTEIAKMYLESFGLGRTVSIKQSKPISVPIEKDAVYRLYNNIYHLWTADHNEAMTLANTFWTYEGVAWHTGDGAVVFRLYDSYSGAHMLTCDQAERDALVGAGWVLEGVAFKSGGDVPCFRLYDNVHEHMFTIDFNERSTLISNGWTNEGIAFYVKK